MLRRIVAYMLETCLIVFCAFTISSGQSDQTDSAAKEAIAKAQAAYLNKDYALAKRELEGALAVKKDLAEPYLLLGMIAWQEGKVDDAITSVQEAIKYQPNYPDAHYVMGKLYLEKRDWKRAEEEANLALSQGSKLASLHVLLGDIALAQSREEPAVNFFEQALAQPSLNSELANETRIKIEAVKNYIEFKANRGNKDYQSPKLSTAPHITKGMKPIPQRKGMVIIKGICTEQGRFVPYFGFYASDKQMGEAVLQRVTQSQHTPARKKGAPVPLWVIFQYQGEIDYVR
jgi:Tfp pilus assembly protein PilF